MPTGTLQGLQALQPNKRSLPEVGTKLLLGYQEFGPMHEYIEGTPIIPNRNYIEVEVKAIKMTKVVLE